MTASFRFVASLCLCVGLLAASGCSKPKDSPVPTPEAKPAVAGNFDADQALPSSSAAAVDPSKALVTVDGAVLTYGEADAMVKRMLLSQGAPEEQLEAILQQMGDSMRGRIVDQFVVSTLLKNEAIARNIEIADAEVESALSNLTTRLPPGTELKTALENMGVTIEQVRKDIRDNERIRKLYESETEKIAAATEEEIAAYYAEHAKEFTKGDEVTARHILIDARDADETKKAEALAKAEGLRKQLLEGADFAELAAANSDCPSKSEGGSLGTFGRGRMVPAFEEAAFALKTNAISEVVETPFGYHIIQVTAHTEGGKTSLEQAHAEIEEKISTQKKNEAFEKVIEGLQAKAKIVQDVPAEVPAFENDPDETTPTEALEVPAEAAPAEAAPAEAAPAEAAPAEAAPVAAVPAAQAEAPVAE